MIRRRTTCLSGPSIKVTKLSLVLFMDLMMIIQFFCARLTHDIISLGNHPIILGGDWNCTYSNDVIANNIDCHNLRNLLNARHSRLLSNLCENLQLLNPLGLYILTYTNTLAFRATPYNKIGPELTFFSLVKLY